jgi:hypothetical protein
MELDRFEYEMLDAVLEAFGQNDSLTREQVLDIFDYDEDYAASMIGFLESQGLIASVGNKLPLVINRDPKAIAFLENGGFVSKEQEIEQDEPAQDQPVIEPEPFLHQAIQLQTESPVDEQALRQLDKRIGVLELRTKYFDYLKYLLLAAGLVILILAVWIIKLLPHHHHN